ncbi:helix-turn-helix domain-containing protein [Staphylococcus pseudintermedius]|nr:helix-turn-helix domain-containing protein [Staphylococcus pseudintermedius]MCE5729892.1 helix-turn-helix domain-containing protein [Staphylococcus pseudintermedius]PCF66475.1 hypothetical protein B5C02_08080 [Staphylococcus pseudintermedius]
MNLEFENVKQDIKKLFKEQNGSQISKATGLPYQTVQDLKNEKTNLDDARLRTIEKLYNYQNNLIKRMNNKNPACNRWGGY